MPQIEIKPTRSAEAIRETLWNNDKYSNTAIEIGPTKHPIGGYCYLASEAFYHLEGGKEYWKPIFQEIKWYSEERDSNMASPHWYLKNKQTGNFVDLTADQFRDNGIDVAYTDGIGRGFVPPTPSAQSDRLIEEINNQLVQPATLSIQK